MDTRSSIARVLRTAGLAAGFAAAGAQAQTLSWNNVAGGPASTAANWTPAQVPTAANSLFFNLNNTYTVTWNASAAASNQHEYNRGNVTLSISSPHSITSQFKVARASTNVAAATLLTGRLNVGTFTVLGQDAGSQGTLNVNGRLSDLLSTDDVIVGQAGTGSLNINAGGFVSTANEVRIGNLATGNGTILVTGVSGEPLVRSVLRTSSTSLGDIIVGATNTGELQVQAGALVDCADDLIIAAGASTEGHVGIGGTSALGSSLLQIASDLDISHNTTGGAAGTGSLDIEQFGVVEITSTLSIGDPHGGAGLLIMNGELLSCDSLICDTTGHAFIEHTAGEIRITGGIAILPTDDFIIGSLDINRPLWRLTNDSSHTVPGNLAVGTGTNRSGQVIIEGGSRMTVLGEATLAGTSNTIGSVIVSGINSLLDIDGPGFYVAKSGTAGLTIDSGGTVDVQSNLFMGTVPDALAIVVASDPGSRLLVGQQLVVGGTDTTTGDASQLRVENGGLLTCGDLLVREQSSLWVTNSTATVQNGATIDSLVLLESATINASTINVRHGELRGSGTVNANVNISSDGTATCVGTLTMGNPGSNAGFGSAGLLDVGSAAVTLLDSNLAIGKNLSLNGGSLTAVNGYVAAGTGQTTGTGTINASFRNAGTIAATGAGITFNDRLEGPGDFGGTRITLGTTGFMFQDCTFACDLVNNGHLAPGLEINEAASSITVNGNYTQGPTGVLDIDLDGCESSDVLHVSGTATLGGTLRLTATRGYIPRHGHRVHIVQCPNVTGLFSSIELFNFPAGYTVAPFLSTQGYGILIQSDCIAEFDGDGFVSGADFDGFVQAFEEGTGAADIDADCFITGNDFDRYVLFFEQGC